MLFRVEGIQSQLEWWDGSESEAGLAAIQAKTQPANQTDSAGVQKSPPRSQRNVFERCVKNGIKELQLWRLVLSWECWAGTIRDLGFAASGLGRAGRLLGTRLATTNGLT